MNCLTAEQLRRNTESRSGWDLYRAHRERVTQLVLQALQPLSRGELCVLGAGNCNDLDLHAILATGWRVQLVDLDQSALLAGVEQQGLADDQRIACHGGIDLTGVWDEIAALTPQSDIESVRAVAQRLATARPTVDLPTGRIVLSIGLLSQLVETATFTIGEKHAGFLELVQGLRLQHLRLAADLVEPGGRLIVTSEIVSTSTAPHIAEATEIELPSVLSKLLLEGNFFSGLHPSFIGQTLRTDPLLSEQLSNLSVAGPWLWHFIARTYAVCAFIATKQAAIVPIEPPYQAVGWDQLQASAQRPASSDPLH